MQRYGYGDRRVGEAFLQDNVAASLSNPLETVLLKQLAELAS